MRGKCALYGNECDLQQSHILPKFIGKYFALTGSKYLRAFANPNKRLQDLDKIPLLSKEAENKFSIFEKWFAENIFKPYQVSDPKILKYNDKLFYFIISVLWRVIHRELRFHSYEDKPNYNDILKAEKEWRTFLSDYTYPLNYDKINILLTDRVANHDFNLKDVDYYMSRCIDSTIVSNPEGNHCFVYVKFLRFILFGYINGGDEEKIKPTRVNPLKGEILIPQPCIDQDFLWFIMDRIKEINILSPPSFNQQEIINEQFFKEYEELKDKEAWEIILNDWLNLDPPSE